MSSASLLSLELCTFLEESVDSLESMRALLLMRDHPNALLSSAQVAAALGVSPVAAAVALDGLVAHRLLVTHGDGDHYRLAKLEPRSLHLLEELARAYWNARVELLAEVAHHSVKRVREQAHRLFREALRHRASVVSSR